MPITKYRMYNEKDGTTETGQVYQTFLGRKCTDLRMARRGRCSGLRTRTIADASDDEKVLM